MADAAIRSKSGASIEIGMDVETVGGRSLGRVSAFDKLLDELGVYAGVSKIRTEKGCSLTRDDILVERSAPGKLIVSMLRNIAIIGAGEEEKDIEMKVAEFDSLVNNAHRSANGVLVLFEAIRLDKEKAALAIERPSILEISDETGWTVADDIASYSQVDVIRALMEKAGVDGRVKRVINTPHKISNGVTTTSIAIAGMTLRSIEYHDPLPVDLGSDLYGQLHPTDD